MKELLEKFMGLFKEWVSKLEANDLSESIKKFKEASELSSEVLKKSEEDGGEVNLDKFFESDAGKEAVKKYVDMYLSASDVTDFMKQVKELAGSVDTLNKTVDSLKEEKVKDDEVVTKTLETTLDRLETVEESLSKTRTSKID